LVLVPLCRARVSSGLRVGAEEVSYWPTQPRAAW
jgi:hypothetical protein